MLLFLLGCSGSYDYETSNSAPPIRTVYNPKTGDTDTFGRIENSDNPSYMNYDTGEIYAPVNRNERPTYLNYDTGEMYWPVGNHMYQNSQGDVFFVH